MNPTFHLFCRISPASPPACRPPAARLCCPLPSALLRPSRLHPRPRRLFPGRPLSPPALLPASAVHLRPPSFAPLPFVSAAPAPVPRPPASRPALRLCPASVPRPPASRPCPAFRPGPFPGRLLRSLPCPPPLSLPGFGSPPPRPAGPAAPIPSSHGPSGPPSSARRCSRTIPRPCTRRETPSPAVWRSAVSGR